MEKPRPRLAKPEQLIIEHRPSLRWRDRVAEVGITLFFWLLLLYLWQPLLSFLAWWFQGYVFYRHMINLGGYRGFAENALWYVLWICTIDGVYLVWARVNQWRFRDKERRGRVPDTELTAHCALFGVAPVDVEQWRHYKRMVVSFDDAGNINTAENSTLADFRQRAAAVSGQAPAGSA